MVTKFIKRLFLLALLAGAGWIALTSLGTGAAIARWAPCPRNWGWLDAWLPRASPLAAEQFRISGGHAKLCYGRPSLRGRDMLGGAAVPFGSLWRTGANEPTTFHLDVPAEVGELFLAPGSYALYTVPGPTSWEIVLNRATRQWGLESEYSAEVAAQEVGRLTVPVERLEAPIETLTLRAVPAGGDDWWIVLEWQTTRIRIPLSEITDEPPAFEDDTSESASEEL